MTRDEPSLKIRTTSNDTALGSVSAAVIVTLAMARSRVLTVTVGTSGCAHSVVNCSEVVDSRPEPPRIVICSV